MQICERCRWRESITELTAGARLCAHCRHELKCGKEEYTITRDVVNPCVVCYDAGCAVCKEIVICATVEKEGEEIPAWVY